MSFKKFPKKLKVGIYVWSVILLILTIGIVHTIYSYQSSTGIVTGEIEKVSAKYYFFAFDVKVNDKVVTYSNQQNYLTDHINLSVNDVVSIKYDPIDPNRAWINDDFQFMVYIIECSCFLLVMFYLNITHFLKNWRKFRN